MAGGTGYLHLLPPAGNGYAISPNDGANLPTATRGLYVGVAGDVKVDLAETGTGIVFTAMAEGLYPLRVKRVYATGTTATNLVGLF